MKKLILIIFIVSGCGKGSTVEGENKTFFNLTEEFCQEHFGVKVWELYGSDLYVECNDGSEATIKNYQVDL